MPLRERGSRVRVSLPSHRGFKKMATDFTGVPLYHGIRYAMLDYSEMPVIARYRTAERPARYRWKLT